MRQRVGSDSRMLIARQQQQHNANLLQVKHMGLALERQLVHLQAGPSTRHEQTRWASAEGQGQLVDLNDNFNFDTCHFDGQMGCSNYNIQEFTTSTTKREIHDQQQQQQQQQQWAVMGYNQF
ncbi:Hypothetical predicted protein [Olea europaea subsp. europaea]|uniref:Uncharacterized protein n=1 Tax=Olea europaea subsp. europaea TaxID=158383 RepID=A0A8S0TH72_OLEEU|nr:Hypothetical predicted protein [Olea europaea subsp. europaea]